MQEIAFFMDDLHTSSLFLMRLGSTDFILRVRATSTLSKMSDIRVYSIQEIRHLIAWFPNSVLIMTRFFDRQNSFQLVFFKTPTFFSVFSLIKKGMCMCSSDVRKSFRTSLVSVDRPRKRILKVFSNTTYQSRRCFEKQ